MMKKVYETPEFHFSRIDLIDVICGSPINPIGGEVGGRTGDEGGEGDGDW